ncbi:hypothetical protein [Candidatus Galacturonibacter soehngenii]|uniref:Large ribosomal subunit protein bL25 L25 domain-containing protein n=1 Tax=Candidatus Galacturonatibacter soehngenii TaxID=2307010 RepID=A0A7V7UH56_9FIRM|nr:hypothetical protein [Candidatus Galacturonibacter soehngenii]KAB1439693.1 hypothetical protein F7O84_04710 [Candidatus Galacturonibacter soehngenii]MBA4687973.1 hypothetical protein [Candidatus Galacturonibacter soehngenii]
MELIKTEIRDGNVKAKKLRREGWVPGCVSGPQYKETLTIQIRKKDAEWLHRKKGEKSKVEIEVQGQMISAVIEEITKDTLKDEILHISFQA